MNRLRFLCLATFFFLQGVVVQAQQPVLYDGPFVDLPFYELVSIIETKEKNRIYYPAKDLDSVRVHISSIRVSKLALLKEALKDTDWYVSIDLDSSIYITRGIPVYTQLATGNSAMVKLVPTKDPAPIISLENRLFTIGEGGKTDANGNVVLSGYIRSALTGEALPGAEIFPEGKQAGSVTNEFGYFQLVLPRGRYVLKISSAGMKPAQRQIQLQNSGSLTIELQDAVASLTAVIVTAEKSSNTRSLQVGSSRLSIKAIKQVPVVFGETDVLKVMLTLPGVTSVGEAANGFNVRGGSADQNLLLLGDATVYNPTHLFGFFSAFHPDIVKQVELYKASIPEKFGGRLSSVLDVSLQDGNSKQWSGSAGIGPLTSSVAIGGPIKKEKATLSFGARTSYSNWIMSKIPDKQYRNSRASFYDLNLRMSFNVNKNNTLYIGAYASDDQFTLNRDTSFQYGNRNLNLKWKHNFSSQLTGVFSTGVDRYQYAVTSDNNEVNAFRLKYAIRQYFLRADFTYVLNEKHQLNAGFQTTAYNLQPGDYQPEGGASLVTPKRLENENGLESAIYLGDQVAVNNKLSISAGIRYTMYQYWGPRTAFTYLPGVPKHTTTIQDTVSYSRGKAIQQWNGPEFRMSARYLLGENNSLKISFTSTQQFIHMLSNTVTISPTDIWKLSDQHIKPQKGMQISMGYYHSFPQRKWETSLEIYYKKIANYLDFKSGSRLLMNEHIETDLINTEGKAYGIEWLLKRTEGRLNGWFSYAYSRILLRQDDPLAGETINKGDYYPANFDRPHAVNLVANYRFSHRLSLSGNLVYTTGRPITLPIAVFNQGGSTGLLYSNRNEYRIPDYFRADLSFTVEGNHKVNQRFHNSWVVGCYNLTARENPYSVYYVQEAGNIKGYQLSIFGTIIPFLSYKIRF